MDKESVERTFLALHEKLEQQNTQARCGLFVIDLHRGDIVHSLNIDGIVEELYDVVTLMGVRRPMAIGFSSDEIRRVIAIGENPYTDQLF